MFFEISGLHDMAIFDHILILPIKFLGLKCSLQFQGISHEHNLEPIWSCYKGRTKGDSITQRIRLLPEASSYPLYNLVQLFQVDIEALVIPPNSKLLHC